MSASVQLLQRPKPVSLHPQRSFPPQVEWEASGVSQAVIPSGNMYRMYLPDGDPYSVTVHAAVPCASTSTISGPGLSITTAGTLASFTLTARDAFSNLRDTFHDEAYGFMYKVNCFYLTPSPPSKRCYIHFSRSLSLNVSFSQVNMRPTSLKTIRPTHSDSGDGLHVMNFNITTAGSGLINAWVAQSGGLHATYFDTEALGSALYVREDTTVDFSGTGDASSTSEWPGATGEAVTADTFSVKWFGFVRPPSDFVYTFSMEIMDTTAAGTNERVKLWVDNQLVINQWDSLVAVLPSGTFHFSTAEVCSAASVSRPQSCTDRMLGAFLIPARPRQGLVRHRGRREVCNWRSGKARNCLDYN